MRGYLVRNEKDNKQLEADHSASYGGSRNRLSYENKHGEHEKNEKEGSDWTTRLGLFLILFAVFALIGLWIVWYFDSSLARIFSKNHSDSSDTPTVQQTYMVTDLDE